MSQNRCYNFEQLPTGPLTEVADANNCGSEPARDDGRTFNIAADCRTAIASKLAPTGGCAKESELSAWQTRCQHRFALAMEQEVRAIAQGNKAEAPVQGWTLGFIQGQEHEQ